MEYTNIEYKKKIALTYDVSVGRGNAEHKRPGSSILGNWGCVVRGGHHGWVVVYVNHVHLHGRKVDAFCRLVRLESLRKQVWPITLMAWIILIV